MSDKKKEPKKLSTLEKAQRVCASAGAAITWADRCSEAEQKELAALYDDGKATYDDFNAWRSEKATQKAKAKEQTNANLEIPPTEREANPA